ncbi:MAG: hypothetical protein SGI97_06240 [candidate division Zixibacteria bacterium]|nr:hypothetical protein [candidate division Zixibacteria bacterium]
MSLSVMSAREHKIARTALYEVMLQSYLFLGFPRMLTAAESLAESWPEESNDSTVNQYTSKETTKWFTEGTELYKRVYAGNFEKLQHRITGFAPEAFRWMIHDGYGKVLSRPGLSIIERELAIMAYLIVDFRPRQLVSHIRGALNLGAQPDLVLDAITVLGTETGEGFLFAQDTLKNLTVSG